MCSTQISEKEIHESKKEWKKRERKKDTIKEVKIPYHIKERMKLFAT
jgi:hypothetical protein